MNQQPFTSAHVTYIVADQGGGKSNTATARTITAGINSITGILKPQTGEYYDAMPLTKEEKFKIRSFGYRLTYDTVKIVTPPDNKIKISKIPVGFSIIPSIKIFCNYHLYGIKYKYLDSWGKIIKGLDEETISDGRLEIDEYNIGANAREGMSGLGRAISKYNFSLRKRHLDVDIMIANERLGEWTTRIVATERIDCSFNEYTKMITLSIKKKGNFPNKEFSYYAPLYWKYYKTDEIFKLPAGQVAKAIAQGS